MRSYRFSWLILGCLSGCLVASLYSSFADKAELYFSGQALPSVYTPLHPAETHYSIQLVRGSEEEKSEEQKSQSSRSRRGRRRTREDRGPEEQRIRRGFEAGNSVCRSNLGIRYTLSPTFERNNTLRHIKAHLKNDLRKEIHSVFQKGQGYAMHKDLVKLIDHIYAYAFQRVVRIHATTYRITENPVKRPIDGTEYTLQPVNLSSASPTGWQGGYNGDGSLLYGYRLVLGNSAGGAKRVVTFYPI